MHSRDTEIVQLQEEYKKVVLALDEQREVNQEMTGQLSMKDSELYRLAHIRDELSAQLAEAQHKQTEADQSRNECQLHIEEVRRICS